MIIVTKEVREKRAFRILAVGKQNDKKEVRCPTLDFFHDHFDSNRPAIAKLTALLTDFQENGPPQDDTKFKKLKGNSELFEFRASELRLLCFLDEDCLVICTNGFIKKKQSTDKRYIETAIQLRSLYYQAKIEKTLLRLV